MPIVLAVFALAGFDLAAWERPRVLPQAEAALGAAPATIVTVRNPRSAVSPHDFSSEADYWWLYCKVVRVKKYGHLECFAFQTDKYDHIRITEKEIKFGRLTEGYKEIKPVEFNKAWAALQKRIARFKP